MIYQIDYLLPSCAGEPQAAKSVLIGATSSEQARHWFLAKKAIFGCELVSIKPLGRQSPALTNTK